jgi:hypothetical protein
MAESSSDALDNIHSIMAFVKTLNLMRAGKKKRKTATRDEGHIFCVLIHGRIVL